MASRQLLDPLVLLRVAPLVTSSASLWFSVDQHYFFSSLISPPIRDKGNPVIHLWWKHSSGLAISAIFILYGISISTAVANLYSGSVASRLYGVGAAFSASHFLFAPFVIDKIKNMSDDEPKGQASVTQRKWLGVHAVRSLFSDLPGWLCFILAVSKSLKAE